jgi:hypothetical protein
LDCADVRAAEYRVVRSEQIAVEPACMPALTRAENGDLLVAFSTEWEPFPWGGVLKLITSRDNGLSWSAPIVLWKDEDPRVTIQVSNGMQTLSNGEVLLPVTYCIVPKREGVSSEEKRPSVIYDWKAPDTGAIRCFDRRTTAAWNTREIPSWQPLVSFGGCSNA